MSANDPTLSQVPKRKLDSSSNSQASIHSERLSKKSSGLHQKSSATVDSPLKRRKITPSMALDTRTHANMKIHGSQERSQGFKGFATSNYQPSTGAKVLKVTNLRTKPRTDTQEYYDRSWKQLDTSLTDIFAGGQPKQSLEQLYKGVQDICRQGDADKLFKRLKDRCERHLSTTVLPAIKVHSRSTNIDILRNVFGCWEEFHKQMVGLNIWCILKI